MSKEIVISPKISANKTRNAILRMKNCSPELRSVLRQRCQERIQNNRTKILSALRKITEEGSCKSVVRNIIHEEWKSIEDDEICETFSGNSSDTPPQSEFNLDEELLLEELLEREFLQEYEEWLLQKYEELLNEGLENPNDIVCPFCCSGYLESNDIYTPNKINCNKCFETFTIDKSLLDLQSSIYECLSRHDKLCSSRSGFITIPKNENESNLCVICDQCSFLSIVG